LKVSKIRIPLLEMSRSRTRDDWEDSLDPCHPTSSRGGEGGHQSDVHGVHQERYESFGIAAHTNADVDGSAYHARSSEYGPEQRGSQESLNNGDAHVTGPGQASYSHNTLLAMPTFSDDSGDGTLDDLTTYSEEYQYGMLQPIEDPTTYMPTPGLELSGYYTQQSHQQNSPAIEPSVDYQMTFDFDIDFDVGFDPGPLEVDFNAAYVDGEQVDYREEAPWSSENHYNEYSRPPVAQVASWADLVGASQTSSASYDSGDTSNLVSSSADTAGDGEDPDWGESSVATLRPTDPRHGNPFDHTGHASNHVNYGEQEQGCSILPTGDVVGHQSAYQFSIPDRTAVQRTSRRE